MRINQVEELVGITKKNIRFYEEEGLIKPQRNPDNGYREYSPADVEQLKKIKLLRKLSVSIEDIHLLLDKCLSFSDCMDRHMIYLNHQQHNLELVKELCRRLSGEVTSLSQLDAGAYLEDMQQLEEGGTRFMDIEKSDIKKKKIAPILSAGLMILALLAGLGALWYGYTLEREIWWVLFIMIIFFGLLITGIVIALVERLKEIDGGEEDEARKY